MIDKNERIGSSIRKVFVNRLLEPKAMLFGLAVLHFLIVLMLVIRHVGDSSNVSPHWNPVREMYEPLLLLLAAVALLFRKFWGYLIAVLASGRVIYVIGYLGLLAISAAHDSPLFSWHVLRTWFAITYKSQPQYLLELAMALVILWLRRESRVTSRSRLTY